MLFGKNKKKENSFISEVDDSRVLVYDFRRRTNLLFENYRAVGYKKPENYHLEQLKSELTDTMTRLINANAVDAGNEDCLIDKILAPVRSGLISLDGQSLDHLDFYHRQDGNMSAHRADIQRILELMREKETVLETEHAHTQMLWNKCYGIKEKMEVVEDER